MKLNRHIIIELCENHRSKICLGKFCIKVQFNVIVDPVMSCLYMFLYGVHFNLLNFKEQKYFFRQINIRESITDIILKLVYSN